VKSEGEFEGYPVKMPMIDVEGIGAGGGSIAWVDSGGALNVGPQSAGAEPGPACYGLGGKLPTVTGANLVLGRLNPDYFLGAEIPLYPDRARQSIQDHVAEPLKLSVEEAAAGIIRVVNANMVRGISVNSTQAGYDVREFSLLAFGGAGPLHAVELAEEININRVVIPPFCSVFSAFGAVASDVRHDYVQTVALSQAQANPGTIQPVYHELETKARALFRDQNVLEDSIRMEKYVDLRYEGQSYELTIPLNQSGPLTDFDLERVIADFHELHERIYAYGDPSEAVEFINLRLTAISKVPEVELHQGESQVQTTPEQKDARQVYFFDTGFIPVKVYERRELETGQRFAGPCLIEETTSTTVIRPGWEVAVDEYRNIVVTREE
jgi:N-methylhydantoinase A